MIEQQRAGGRPGVLCVGQLAADILIRPVDRLDFASDTRRVECIELSSGGDCLNVALALKRLGCRVGLVGKVGEDDWADFLVEVMAGAGCRLSNPACRTWTGSCPASKRPNASLAGTRQLRWQHSYASAVSPTW